MNMARRTGASARTRALVRATEAVARREAERVEREKRLQAVLADFFHAQSQVERIQVQAEIAAAPFEARIQDAICALGELGETRAGIAELTGLPLPRVRQYLATAGVTCQPSDATADATGMHPGKV